MKGAAALEFFGKRFAIIQPAPATTQKETRKTEVVVEAVAISAADNVPVSFGGVKCWLLAMNEADRLAELRRLIRACRITPDMLFAMPRSGT